MLSVCCMLQISIHAPRAGSDYDAGDPDGIAGISIHAPRAGSDGLEPVLTGVAGLFQSTLPVRGATVKTRIIIRIFK